ncbi:hypothetical protein HQ45_05520 [Porphyromonas crevioricanis]|uniref:Lipoprotein n=2 Tax=Porphyromonas crevioricanis TaxID=393921 RepID=A0A0A2FGX5_9PORP|nr:hypothetical protein [Porphyromonas crevioricanis]KGN90248.1 hypothetical protein HQ45_05520 [Porphyromonas crevioricanis]KGN96348.1 hypothetical protein HQ38_01785 [Porphyromonas crevioricanis]SJZ95470.1 hypothetical protein SAMN02745203_01380 [Porphyromonas crevioricanis]SQH72678.1 Uncharacterised protein [Porphyromonas crevioricanis]GAD04865.1 hypothetical protein PORCRE_562 [Porphyromonas crevioricanis JCM 15906]
MKKFLSVAMALFVMYWGLLFVGCSKVEKGNIDPQSTTLTITIPAKEVPFTIDPASFAGANELRGGSEKVLYEDIIEWDYEEALESHGINPQALQRVRIKGLDILFIEPQDLDVVPFRTFKAYMGTPYDLVAEGDSQTEGTEKKVDFIIHKPDFLKLLQSKNIPIKLTCEGQIPPVPNKIEAVLTIKVEVTGFLSDM